MSTSLLFRREAVEAKRTSWVGSISLAQPARSWMLTGAAVLAACVVCLFLAMATYTRRSTVSGRLAPSKGMASVIAPVSGIVSRLDVAEGDRVATRQVLAVISVPRATIASGDTVEALEQRLRQRLHGLAEEQAAQDQLISTQANGLAAQLAAARREHAQLDIEVSTRQGQVRIARETLERMRHLSDARYVSTLQFKQQESEVLEQVSELQSLQRQAIVVARTIVQLEQEMRALPGRRRQSEAKYSIDRAAIEQEQIETEVRGTLAVNAPVGGVVATQMVKTGQAIQAGQALMSVLPGNGSLEAELLVPSRAIGFIEPGDGVLLRYQAFPYQKFGHQRGKVLRVSRSALSPGELDALVGTGQTSEPFYRVTVALARQSVFAYGREEQLKPGMLLEADVLGERRRLIEWIFEPLYSISGRMGW